MKAWLFRRFHCTCPFSLLHSPRFRKPPVSSRTVGFPESGWRPWHFLNRPSQHCRSLSAGPHTPLTILVCLLPRNPVNFRVHRALCPDTGPFGCPPCAESRFAPAGRYPSGGNVYRHLARHYPHIIALAGSCARPKPSHFLRPSPRQWVFAGCCQPLLGVGPSRHYLCNPCMGAWTPIPQCPPSALARFFPRDNGLTSEVTSSAHQNCPRNATSTGM